MDEQRDEGAGYGDDQGTRVGKPESGRAGQAPGEYPGVDEGARDSSRRAASGEADGTPRSGMGNEAAEGIHAARADERDERAPSSLSETTGTGREHEEGATRSGSEPLVERERVAESSYGGEGGEPRVPPDRPH